ncbi:MAG: TetR/AcrR family transcriptional regulator [Butyrivibrio sp.]|nr:TetR/AcrR family transcriptional regulator [Butyrivibrio sp.]
MFDAFFILLKEREIDKITVSDVIKKAGLVRSTFYNHYENIPALITAAEDKTIENIFTMMESFHPKDDRAMCKSFFLSICNYTKDNVFLATLLNSPRGDIFFEKMMEMFKKYISTVSLDDSNPNKAEHSKYFIAGSIGNTVGVLHKWSTSGFNLPEDEVAEILTTVFVTGILPYLRSSDT